MLITLDAPAVVDPKDPKDVRYWSKFAIFTPDTGALSGVKIGVPVGILT